MNDQKDVVNVSTLDLFKVYKENHSKLIYLSKRLENIELTIEKYPYQSGLSSRTTNRIDSLRKLNSIYEDEMVSVNVNLIMYNYDHLRMYNYSVSPS